MSQLASIIEKAADAFARKIIGAVKGATLQELLAVGGAAAPARRRGRPAKGAPARKRGRPAKTKPGRKPGRPPKAVAKRATAKKSVKKPTKKPVKTSVKNRRSINYPKCSVPGCGKNRYARGNGMCGAHFKAAQGGATA